VLIFVFCVGAPSRQTWIELCQKAGTDPHDLVNRNVEKLLKIVLDATEDLNVHLCVCFFVHID
jgi:hypothetical protein